MKQQEATSGGRARLPAWLRKRIPPPGRSWQVHKLLEDLGLMTVCSSARCPNLCECFSRGTASFLILGPRCSRSCRFCAVPTGAPTPPRQDEPQTIAEACARLSLRHVVVTSVTRDDLPDGGAEHFARTIRMVRAGPNRTVIEVLTSDFRGDLAAVETVLRAGPDVFNHNVETVPRLYQAVRPQADYCRSLQVLLQAGVRGSRSARRLIVKSGMMVGLGETDREVTQVMRDLRIAGVDALTIGQYLAPSAAHIPVARYVEPVRFDAWRDEALSMGFAAVAAGPLVRSSYRAEMVFESIQAGRS
jgi:lipoic acid synthetase